MTTNGKPDRALTTVFLLGLVVTGFATLWMVAGSTGQVILTPVQLVIVAATGTAAAAITVRFGRSRSLPLWWIISSAALLRLLCLFGQPLFEDDYFRYLWDGMQLVTTGDPFSLPPSAWFGAAELPAAWEDILSRINYPDVATVYGPALQWLFGLSYIIAPAAIWPLQLMAATADILVVTLLASAVRQHGTSSANMVLLYAWSPLLLKEFALSAHPDVFAVLLVVLALGCGVRGMIVLAGLLCGFAVAIKVFALIALPFLLTPVVTRSQGFVQTIKLVAGCGIALGATTLVYGSFDIWFPEGLRAMASGWLFNAPLHVLLQPLFGLHGARLLLLAVFAVTALLIVVRTLGRGVDHSALALAILSAVLLLALPVLNPWYLIWVLAFAVWRPWRWPWVASVAVVLSYWSGYGSGVAADALYQLPALSW